MKTFILKFGKYKGGNFFDTPSSYQTWLMAQDWFTEKQKIKDIIDNYEQKIWQEKNIAEKKLRDTIYFIEQYYLSLVGRKISAYGWSYDNCGTCIGTINKVVIEGSGNLTKVRVYIEEELTEQEKNFGRMRDFAFTYSQYYTLLREGCLPKPNKFLNTGTDAELK